MHLTDYLMRQLAEQWSPGGPSELTTMTSAATTARRWIWTRQIRTKDAPCPGPHVLCCF